MPKKKLTKSQVKRKYKTICTQFYDMMLDKLGHTDSNVGMSVNKLLDLHKVCQTMLRRMK